jgi:hypothetical protein
VESEMCGAKAKRTAGGAVRQKTRKCMIVYLLNRAGNSAHDFFAKTIVSLTRRCFWLEYRFCLFVSSVSCTV